MAATSRQFFSCPLASVQADDAAAHDRSRACRGDAGLLLAARSPRH
jgi:hypothetical protein